MVNDKKYWINISEEHGYFFWSPAKTGSVHANVIFSCLNFVSYLSNYDRKINHDYSEFPVHHHNLNLFENHQNYKLICTARNPLNRIFSSFLYSYREREKLITKSEFYKFYITNVEDSDSLWFAGMNFVERKPDYFVRLEHLFSDYMKIPFVFESKFAKSGFLEELCRKKKNPTKIENYNIKDFFTTDMVDDVYQRFQKYFDELDYKPVLK